MSIHVSNVYLEELQGWASMQKVSGETLWCSPNIYTQLLYTGCGLPVEFCNCSKLDRGHGQSLNEMVVQWKPW